MVALVLNDDEFSGNLDSRDSLKIAWNILLQKHYLNAERLKSKNRGWKSAAEINTLLASIRCWEKYATAKHELQVKSGKVVGTKTRIPQQMRDLREEAKAGGGYKYNRDVWSRKVVDGNEYLMRTKKHKKTGVVTVVRMIAVEDSYEFLLKVHTELGHTGGCSLWDYVTDNEVSSYPKDLVLSFPMFCSCCRKQERSRQLKKKVNMQTDAKEEITQGNDAMHIFTLSCPIDKTLSECENLVIAIYFRTEYVICKILDEMNIAALLDAVSADFVHTGFPTKVHFTVPESFQKNEFVTGMMDRYNIEVSIAEQVGPEYRSLKDNVVKYFNESLIDQSKKIRCSVDFKHEINLLVIKWNDHERLRNQLMDNLVLVQDQIKETVPIDSDPLAVQLENDEMDDTSEVAEEVVDDTSCHSKEIALSYQEVDDTSCHSKEIALENQEVEDGKQTSSSSSSSKSTKSVSKLNKNDLDLIKAPEKPAKGVTDGEEANESISSEDTSNLEEGSSHETKQKGKRKRDNGSSTSGDEHKTDEDETTDGDKTDDEDERLLRYRTNRRKYGSGKTPRNYLTEHVTKEHDKRKEALKAIEENEKDEIKIDKKMRLRRQSKRRLPNRFDPCEAGTQKVSNITKKPSIGSKATATKESHEESSDESSVSSSTGVDISLKVGRSRVMIPITLNVENENRCSVCLTSFDDGGDFTYEFTHARICAECSNKDPPPLNIELISKYISDRTSSNLKKCLACNSALDIASHRFGDYRFCTGCVSDGDCPCSLCRNLKTACMRKIQKTWECRLPQSSDHKAIYNDFSSKSQIMLFMRREKIPTKMGEILHAFTSLSTKKNDPPVICANHCEMRASDVLSFGTMKCHNARISDRPTFYQWIVRSGKKRMFSPRTMSYAQELLNNIQTVCIPHCENMVDFRVKLQQKIISCRDMNWGIFSFHFIQVFVDQSSVLVSGSSWTSFVIDLRQKVQHYFDKKNTMAKNVLAIVNSELNDEWNHPDHGEMGKTDFEKITMGDMAKFSLPIFEENEKYLWDAGLASILHSWAMTSPDIFGNDNMFDAESEAVLDVFDLLDDRLVEKFRQMVLFWLLGNDMNMHLYIDFKEPLGKGWIETK